MTDDPTTAHPEAGQADGDGPRYSHHDLLTGAKTLPPLDEARRELKHSLADELRSCAESASLLDATAEDEDDMRSYVALARALSGRLASAASLGPAGGPNFSTTWQAALTERSPVSGRSNPVAAPLRIEGFVDGVLHAHAVFTHQHEGPPLCAHGGVIAAAFDEMVGVAQATAGVAGVTGTLAVRMRRPTPLHQRIDFRAEYSKVDGRKIFVSAHSLLAGEVLAEADAIMIVPRDGSVHRQKR